MEIKELSLNTTNLNLSSSLIQPLHRPWVGRNMMVHDLKLAVPVPTAPA
jgi:hypothetical protein